MKDRLRLLVVLFLVGAGVTFVHITRQTPEEREQLTQGKTLSEMLVQASVTEVEMLDRTDNEWMKAFCFAEIAEAARIPVSYARIRGPLYTLTPIHETQRFDGAKDVETCTLDYYVLPVVEQAFADIGIEHSYSELVWGEFQEVITASVSAGLREDGWTVLNPVDEDSPVALMMYRYISEEDLWEYVDLFMTKNEEIVFEMNVVDK